MMILLYRITQLSEVWIKKLIILDSYIQKNDIPKYAICNVGESAESRVDLIL